MDFVRRLRRNFRFQMVHENWCFESDRHSLVSGRPLMTSSQPLSKYFVRQNMLQFKRLTLVVAADSLSFSKHW